MSTGSDWLRYAGAQCQCPMCVEKRVVPWPAAIVVLSPASISKMYGLGITTQPAESDIAPPPTKWLTNMKPDTDTVEQRAAFLLKQGIACPTTIDADDVNAINNAMGLM